LVTPLVLPIDPLVPEILNHLGQASSLVLQAAPGSGKTTRVPPALLHAPFLNSDQEILVLEPRRLAAKLAAQRVADEHDEQVGGTIGYQFRFERVASAKTRLTFLTEGMLMRRLLSDPELRRVAAVMLDEFHERHLHGDVAIAYLRRLQQAKRSDLKIVVMSATLDSDAVATFLGGCRILRSEGRRFDVAIDYLPQPPAKPLEALVATAVGQLLAQQERLGDVLVFLPGMAEIRRAQAAVQKAYPHVLALPLHGELSRAEQDLALRPADRTKIILSTNVAESSLTIEGVTAVIDSGLERSAGYSHWTGVPTLKVRPISRASADQRAGRAGRTAPGRCLRLYTKWDYDTRAPFTAPEIQRADLTQTVLELKSLGVRDARQFAWFEAPAPTAIAAADELLFRLGATLPEGELTDLGRQMTRRAAHPRLAKLMIEAGLRGVAEPAATLAALLQEGRLEELDALAEVEHRPPSDDLFRRARKQFFDLVEGTPKEKQSPLPGGLRYAILSAFPDRVARKQKTDHAGRTSRVHFRLAAGGSASSVEAPIVRSAETFVVLDVQERDAFRSQKSELTVRALVPIPDDLLFELKPSPVIEREEVLWDAPRGRVMSVSRLCFGEISLIESAQPPTDKPAAARLLAKEGFHLQPDRFAVMSLPEFLTHAASLPSADRLASLAARLEVIAQNRPELGVPVISAESLGGLILKALEGFVSLDEVKRLDVARLVIDALPPAVGLRLDALAPMSVVLAGGRKVGVHYDLGRTPWIQSRLQDFFGMRKGPAILDGTLPLTLHLLAPNGRPVQVTTDLEGFWQRAYLQLRRDLSRNYPKHRWPDDPLKP
jgi:ATP-dependent helicase HrpB